MCARLSLGDVDSVIATFMFTDIVGSINIASELGDGPWRDLLGAHHAAVRHELVVYRGTKSKQPATRRGVPFSGSRMATMCGSFGRSRMD